MRSPKQCRRAAPVSNGFSGAGVGLLTLAVLTIDASAAGDTLPIPEGFQSVTLGACHLVLRPKNAGVVSEVAELCRERVPEIYEQLGQARGDETLPAEVRIVSSPQEMKDVAPEGKPPPVWSGAVAYPEYNMIIVPLRNHLGSPLPEINTVMEHEFSHLALRRALNEAEVPRWFSEGVAIQQSEKSSFRRHWLVWLAARRDRLMPLNQIEEYPDQVIEVNLAYAQAADFVGLMLKEGGWLSIRALIRRLKEGAEFDEAVEYAFGRTLASLETEWRSGLMSRWQWIPLVTGTGAVWGLIVALFFLAYYFARKRKKKRLKEMAVEEATLERVIGTLDDLHKRALPSAPKAKSAQQIPTKIRIDDEIHTLH